MVSLSKFNCERPFIVIFVIVKHNWKICCDFFYLCYPSNDWLGGEDAPYYTKGVIEYQKQLNTKYCAMCLIIMHYTIYIKVTII